MMDRRGLGRLTADCESSVGAAADDDMLSGEERRFLRLSEQNLWSRDLNKVLAYYLAALRWLQPPRNRYRTSDCECGVGKQAWNWDRANDKDF